MMHFNEIFNKLMNDELNNNLVSDKRFYDSWKESLYELDNKGIKQIAFKEVIRNIQNSIYLEYYKKSINSVNSEVIFNEGVHGLNHIIRSSIFVLIISFYESISLDDFKLALDSIFYHDIGRINDIDDDNHGYNAIKKIDFLNNKYTEEELNIIKFIIVSHCLDDNKANDIAKNFNVDEKKAIRLLKIIKDADALDRVREYPYLDINYLRTKTASELVDFSYLLYSKIK